MRRPWVGLASVIVVIAVVGAWLMTKPESPSTPERTMELFFDKFNYRDADAMYNLFTPELKSEHPKAEVEGILDAAKSFGTKVLKWKILSTENMDDYVRIEIQITAIGLGEKSVDKDNSIWP